MNQGQQRIALSLAMIVVGFLATARGIPVVPMWAELAAGSQIYFVVSAFGGVALLACGATMLLPRIPLVAKAFLGAVFSFLLFVNQVIGLLLNTMLCFGPT